MKYKFPYNIICQSQHKHFMNTLTKSELDQLKTWEHNHEDWNDNNCFHKGPHADTQEFLIRW